MTAFGRRLTQLRQESGLRQSELAAKLGISRSAIGMYEQGRRDPDFALLDAMADLFDVDLSYMLGKTDVRGKYPKSAPQSSPPATVKKQGKKLLMSIPITPNYKPVRTRPGHDQVLQAYDEASPDIQAAVRRVLGIEK